MKSRRTVLLIIWSAIALVAILALVGWLRSRNEVAQAPPTPVAEEGTGEVETILFPILIGPEPLEVGEREWKTMVIATSRVPEAFFVGFEDQPIAITPGTSRPREFSRTALSGVRALGPKELVDDVTFDLLLRDEATGAVVTVPVLKGSQLGDDVLTITGLAPGEPSRTLRIFDALRTVGAQVEVRAMRGDELIGERTLDLGQVENIGPAFTELALPELGVTAGEDVTIEIEPIVANMQLWAMVVETDETGMIRIVTP